MKISFYKLSLIILLAIIFTVIALFLIDSKYKVVVVKAPTITHTPAPIVKNDVSTSTQPSPIENLKLEIRNSSLLLPVPFTPQAPTANWDTMHNEDCEEAGAIMVAEYFSGNKNARLDSEFVEEQLTKLTNWEMQTFGYNLDINSEEVVKMITTNYGLQAKIITDVTEENIKKELAQNHLVLLPANGQLLGNPNYKQPGPKYHMLVIRGYTPTSIITNDPGTRNGLNYVYDFETLYNANGNWDHAISQVDRNIKNMIVVWKE
ncbi:MAG: C39 family peptidase [Candidatus Doudnabacteria bacterium]|jgi:hypothetical protein